MTELPDSLKLVPAKPLKPSGVISDALAQIGDRYGAIVVVVDEEDRLCGVVSPGDLRKAILNGHNADTPLKTVMNSSPVSIAQDQLNEEAIVNAVLAEFRQLYTAGMMYAMAPVTDGDGRVLGLIDLQSLAHHATNVGFPVSHRRVLVIGGAGFIGSVLTRQLIADGWSVRVLDLFLYEQDSLAGLDEIKLEIVQGDVKNIDVIVEAIEGVDAVVYLAELVGDPAVSIAPQTALKTNYLAVTTLAHLCTYVGINRFVYTSSCSVYGATATPDILLTEESPTAPVSLYGKIKLLVEEAVLSMARQPNRLFAPTVLRLGTVFGHSPRARFDLVVNTLVKNALRTGGIELFGGAQWRPHVHVADVSRAITNVLDAPLDAVRAQIFNVGGTRNNHTIDDLGDMVNEAFPSITVTRRNTEKDPRNYRVNCDKIRDLLGFEPNMSVPDGIRELKEALEAGGIDDADEPKYSNYRTVQGLAFE